MTEELEKSAACKDYTFSSDIIHLYDSATVQNANEAVTVLFHTFMLESGFIPKDVSNKDKYQCMPKDWNGNGVFKIKYEHFCCPAFACCMTCVPLYNTLSVHGIICDVDCVESVDIKVNVKNYLKQRKDFSNVCEVFSDVRELSKYFKDDFCLPLLNLLHETIGASRLFGLRGLLDEVKTYILQLLPVECVVSMSAVDKNFNHLANLPVLWKHLYRRDFAKDGEPDIETARLTMTWKQMYVKEYRKKKRKLESRPYLILHRNLPQLYSIGPDYDTDLNIHFDPPLPQLYPSFQTTFPPVQPRYPFLRRLL